MVKRSATSELTDLRDLAGHIVEDAGKLLSQQVDLLRAEVRQELRQAAGAAVSVASGSGLAAAAGILSGMMLAHLLHKASGLPLWASYGAVGGALGAAGYGLLRSGGKGLAGLHLIPPQTAQAVKENLTWLKQELTPAAT